MSAHILSQFGLEPMVSSKVASLALGVSTKTVVSWIETGTLEGAKLGDRWLILLPSLKTVQQHARDKVWASTNKGSGSMVMAEKAMQDLDDVFNRRAT